MSESTNETSGLLAAAFQELGPVIIPEDLKRPCVAWEHDGMTNTVTTQVDGRICFERNCFGYECLQEKPEPLVHWFLGANNDHIKPDDVPGALATPLIEHITCGICLGYLEREEPKEAQLAGSTNRPTPKKSRRRAGQW